MKVICIGLNKDKGMIKDIFNMKNSGFGSCVNCLILGEFCEGAVHFPFNKQFWPKRSEEYAKECERIRLILNLQEYGGHFGTSVWTRLGLFDLFSILNIDDPMHDFVGFIDLLFSMLNEEEKLKLLELDKQHFKLTKETMAHSGEILIISFN